MQRRHYSSYAVSRRATQRGQDKADDEYYAAKARKDAEAAAKEAAELKAKTKPATEGEKKNG